MFLSKASVVLLVAIFGTSWFPGHGFASASPLPQGYYGLAPQNQLPYPYPNNNYPYPPPQPQGYYGLAPQNQLPYPYPNNNYPYPPPQPQGYYGLAPQNQLPYPYPNNNYPYPPPQPQGTIIPAPSHTNSETKGPLIDTWKVNDCWVQNSIQSVLRQQVESIEFKP